MLPLLYGPSFLELASYRGNVAWELRKKEEEFLLACVKGGMSYDDAKAACAKEYGDRIARAEKQYEEDMAKYRARREERLREEANRKKPFWVFW